MNIQKRIKQYLDFKSITPYKFCKELHFSMGYLDKKGAIGTDKYLKIIEYYLEINPVWLLTGNGKMLREPTTKQEVAPLTESTIKDKLIATQEESLVIQKKTVAIQEKEIARLEQEKEVLAKKVNALKQPPIIEEQQAKKEAS